MAKKLNLPIAIMLDTKGPEYRIKTFKNDKVVVCEGNTFTFTTEDIEGDETHVSVTYKQLCDNIDIGDTILVNNGLVIFEVESVEGTEINCKVLTGGELSNRKSMSFPGKLMSGPYLSEQDKADLLFGVKNEVDYVACSFVSCKQDMIDIRNYLSEIGGEYLDLIAKIENQSGYDNIEEIDTAINENLVGWSAKRISKVSRAILRLAVCELMYSDIPVGVAINEAVDMAKKFSSDEAPAFINGVLGKAAQA